MIKFSSIPIAWFCLCIITWSQNQGLFSAFVYGSIAMVTVYWIYKAFTKIGKAFGSKRDKANKIWIASEIARIENERKQTK